MSTEHATICFTGMTKRSLDLSIAKQVGERMRDMRVGVFGEKSKTHLAGLIGVQQSDISRWESGERVCTVAQAVRFAKACGRDATQLFSGIVPALAEQELLPLHGVDAPAAELLRDLVEMLKTRTRQKARSQASPHRRRTG
jgi:transcriptional regulator with XRE-family HTH domain